MYQPGVQRISGEEPDPAEMWTMASREGKFFPLPEEVTKAALDKIQPDGSIMRFDEEQRVWFAVKTANSIDLNKLDDQVYTSHLSHIARALYKKCYETADSPPNLLDRSDWALERFAQLLAPYRHDRDFLEEAMSFVKVDDNHELLFYRSLPLGYVPMRHGATHSEHSDDG